MNNKNFKNKKGQSSVEFSFTIIFFLIFILALTDMVRICYSWVSLQYAVNEAARSNSLGRDVNVRAQNIATALGIPLSNVQLLDLNDGPINTGQGNALTFVRVIVNSSVRFNPVSNALLGIMGYRNASFDIKAETMIRNEPFN